MDDGADLFFGDAIVQGAFAVDFPFVHFAQSADHREVHHRAGFGVDHVVAPPKAPAPCGHGFLKGAREVVSGGEVFFDIFGTKRAFALLKTFQE